MSRATTNNEPLQIQPGDASAYPVYTALDWDRLFHERLIDREDASAVFVITQSGLGGRVAEGIDAILSRYGVPGSHVIPIGQGESAKHISNLGSVYNRLIELGVDRKSLLLAIGGGVVGDFAGFVAATVLRGIRFVQFPTTLLSAVDSSVGGKVAVNVDRGKNMVGAFYHPRFVYLNQSVLATLPDREWVCGIAEMFKHGLMDAKIMTRLLERANCLRDPVAPELTEAIRDSIHFKARVVAQDEREGGLRAILNLGHTTAHAIESITNYSRFSHGEAVSRGLATALLLSRECTGLADEDADRMLEAMQTLGLPRDTAGMDVQDILDHMRFDKKGVAGIPRFVLLKAIGEPTYGELVEEDTFRKVWKEQRERFG